MIYEEGLLHFLRNADNVYRTKHFIVKQVIEVQEHSVEGNSIVSFDTYYRRTPKRDLAYNLIFKAKTNLEGKRLPSTLYTRTYIE